MTLPVFQGLILFKGSALRNIGVTMMGFWGLWFFKYLQCPLIRNLLNLYWLLLEGCLNLEEGYKLDHAMPTDTSVRCVLEELVKLVSISDFCANSVLVIRQLYSRNLLFFGSIWNTFSLGLGYIFFSYFFIHVTDDEGLHNTESLVRYLGKRPSLKFHFVYY